MQESSAVPPNRLNIFLRIPVPLTQHPLSAGGRGAGGRRSQVYNDSLENVVKVGEKDNPQSNSVGYLRKLFWILFYEIKLRKFRVGSVEIFLRYE